MTMVYPSAVHRRGRFRKVVDTLEGYIRIDLVEERMFPATTIMRYLAVAFPVLLYYFQSTFLAMSEQVFLMMIIGTAVIAGLQDALTGLTSRLNFAMERGTLETYLVEPVPWALIPVAMNIWRSFTGAVLACVMVGMGVLLGAPIETGAIPLALLVLFLGILACNALGSFAAAFIVLFKRGEPVVALYSLAAAVLGGALFPIEVMPVWIRWMSYLVPHSYVINAARQLLMAEPPPAEVSAGWSIAILAVFCVVTFVAGLYVFDRALRLARRLGILSI
jgi:ABC-2 type transport system permease protein